MSVNNQALPQEWTCCQLGALGLDTLSLMFISHSPLVFTPLSPCTGCFLWNLMQLCVLKLILGSQGDGSVGKVLAEQTWGLEFGYPALR